MAALLIKNIANLYTPDVDSGFGQVKHMVNRHLLIEDDRIAAILSDRDALPRTDTEIDASGKCLLPGFVDAHTHPIFWKTREDEFIMRIKGRSYEEIAAAGGGIRNSVRRFRQASKTEIKEVSRLRVRRFLEFGVTTIEAKSGYGLSFDDEVKSLEIIDELNREEALDMVPTFLGAHEVPDEYQQDRQAYVDLINQKMIPFVAQNRLARYCDVFCEKGVFSVSDSRAILLTGQRYGLRSRIHADELSAFGGADLAAEIRACTADHLVRASDDGIRAMARAGVVAVLLPGTTFFLGKDSYAPARRFIEAGCQIALSTDFNPGSSATQNIQLIWTIAALKMGLLPDEMLWATTLTPAKSLQLEQDIGSIEPGKKADLVLMDIPNLNYLAYHYGVNHTHMTIKNGRVVYESRPH